MAEGEAAIADQALDRFGQVEQAAEVGDRAAVFAEAAGELGLGEAQLLEQGLVGEGAVEGIAGPRAGCSR